MNKIDFKITSNTDIKTLDGIQSIPNTVYKIKQIVVRNNSLIIESAGYQSEDTITTSIPLEDGDGCIQNISLKEGVHHLIPKVIKNLESKGYTVDISYMMKNIEWPAEEKLVDSVYEDTIYKNRHERVLILKDNLLDLILDYPSLVTYIKNNNIPLIKYGFGIILYFEEIYNTTEAPHRTILENYTPVSCFEIKK